MLRRSARSLGTLARWLGPWAEGATPRGVARSAVRLEASRGPMKVYEYACGQPHASYLVLPGLHFLGPDDPRLDRFCRVLARAGFFVVAPVIPAYAALTVEPSAVSDARVAYAHAVRAAARRGLGTPALFSVSFGSTLAFELLADEGLEPRPRGAMIFGGFAELGPTVRFAATGRAEHEGEIHVLPSDPLNLPVVALHLLPYRSLPGDRGELERALREMVYRTWGRMELKRHGARAPIADEVAASLSEELRPSFYAACGLGDESEGWFESGLAESIDRLGFFDPGARLARVEAPVTLVHGRDDDVIPYLESLKLERALSGSRRPRLHLTGMYGHTGSSRPPLSSIARETAVLTRMLHDLAHLP